LNKFEKWAEGPVTGLDKLRKIEKWVEDPVSKLPILGYVVND
jgi:hypothetical protein